VQKITDTVGKSRGLHTHLFLSLNELDGSMGQWQCIGLDQCSWTMSSQVSTGMGDPSQGR